MVIVIKINTSGELQKLPHLLKRKQTQLPLMTKKGMKRWGKILEVDLRRSAKRAKIESSTGELFGSGIQYRQKKQGNTGYLFMRVYGVKLDSMNPHYVKIKESRTRLLAWALRARNKYIRDKAKIVKNKEKGYTSIYVKPHPFIDKGYNRARRKLRPILKRIANRAMKS